ncbi:hypothetical protein [Rhodoferax sp.]|uniref:hypothetical protein n=1 Tax=Rhodoferax sp. TaxID=50421 RepID=UPI00374C9C26
MKPTLSLWPSAILHAVGVCTLMALPPAALAQSSCSSDGQPVPTALLERFISADCDACWNDAQAAQPSPTSVALDWIVPGARGDDAPLSAAARQDGLERLHALSEVHPSTEVPAPNLAQLRVAHGLAVGGYIGTSIELRTAAGGPPLAGPLTAWLALVESIPAGTDGTPVPRNLVRNTLVLDWNPMPDAAQPLSETRPLNIPEGVQSGRLRVVGWVEDAHARIVAAAQSLCATADN